MEIKSFKEFLLQESKIELNSISFDTMKGTSGTGLALEFSKEQSEKLISVLEKEPKLESFVKSVNKDYSGSIYVTYNDLMFSLYARDGIFRVGGSIWNSTNPDLKKPIDMSTIDDIKQELNINKFLKDLAK